LKGRLELLLLSVGLLGSKGWLGGEGWLEGGLRLLLELLRGVGLREHLLLLERLLGTVGNRAVGGWHGGREDGGGGEGGRARHHGVGDREG